MKKFLKYLPVALMVTVMALGLAACKDDDEDEPNHEQGKIEGCDPAITGTWRASDFTYTELFTFNDDGTFTFNHNFGGTSVGDPYTSVYSGIYAAQNGTIELTFTSRSHTQNGSTQTTDFDEASPVRGTYSIKSGIMLIKGFSVPDNNSIPMFDTFAQQ